MVTFLFLQKIANFIMNPFAPNSPHEALLTLASRSLAFKPGCDFPSWCKAVDARLRALIGDFPKPVPAELKIEYEREQSDYHERFFCFASEENCRVPCHLLTPKNAGKPFPVIICLQGHNSGMHLSLGRARGLKDWALIRMGHRDIGLQAVKHGFAALVMEQRCFGLRKDDRPKEFRQNRHSCHHTAMTALLLGRTLIGERVWDVLRTIDVISGFPELDARRVACLGHSAGGTVAYYAACLDERIKAVMASCAVCTFAESIGTRDHCMDNYLPGALKYFDMGDLACLIAPRPLICVAGKQDGIFPLHGVRQAFDTIASIYAATGNADKCRLVEGPGAHHFYPDPAWPAFKEITGWQRK